eukprot:7890-Heterococcus_DN1.PRE.2
MRSANSSDTATSTVSTATGLHSEAVQLKPMNTTVMTASQKNVSNQFLLQCMRMLNGFSSTASKHSMHALAAAELCSSMLCCVMQLQRHAWQSCSSLLKLKHTALRSHIDAPDS